MNRCRFVLGPWHVRAGEECGVELYPRNKSGFCRQHARLMAEKRNPARGRPGVRAVAPQTDVVNARRYAIEEKAS